MGHEIDPESIGAGSIAARRPGLSSVEVDRELVIYDDDARILHHLNPTASLIWTCLDGTGSLIEIAYDMAEAYRTQPGPILEDILEVTRQLGAKGLIVAFSDGEDRPAGPSRAVEAPPPAFAEEPAWGIEPQEPEPEPDDDDEAVREADTAIDAENGLLGIAVGNQLVGLRASTPALAEMAAAVLRPSLLGQQPTWAGVSLVETTPLHGRGLLWCYRSGEFVARARGPRRAMAAIIAMLSSYNDEPDAYVHFPGALFVRGEQAALLPIRGRLVLDGLAPRLRRSGWVLADSVETTIDPESGQVVIEAPTVPIDAGALTALPADPLDVAGPLPGRYTVRAWISIGGGDLEPTTRTARVASVAASGRERGMTDRWSVLAATATMLHEARWLTCPRPDPRLLASAFAVLSE